MNKKELLPMYLQIFAEGDGAGDGGNGPVLAAGELTIFVSAKLTND